MFDDGVVVPGAAAFEIYARDKLLEYAKHKVSGKAIVGVEAFAEALLVIPKCLATNAGQDPKEAIINVFKANQENEKDGKNTVFHGIDLANGKAINPALFGIFVYFFLNFRIISVLKRTF